MKLLDLFRSHKHYWGAPAKRAGGHTAQVCSGCGKERRVRLQAELPADAASEAAVRNALYPPPQKYNRARPSKA